jgi:hypothetical protein
MARAERQHALLSGLLAEALGAHGVPPRSLTQASALHALKSARQRSRAESSLTHSIHSSLTSDGILPTAARKAFSTEPRPRACPCRPFESRARCKPPLFLQKHIAALDHDARVRGVRLRPFGRDPEEPGVALAVLVLVVEASDRVGACRARLSS